MVTGLTMDFTWRLVANPITVQLVRKISKTQYAPPVTVNNCQVKLIEQQNYVDGVLLTYKKPAVNMWREKLQEGYGVGQQFHAPKTHDVVIITNDGVQERNTITLVEHCGRDVNGVQRYRCFLERE